MMAASQSSRIAPPSLPMSPVVCSPSARASRRAASTLGCVRTSKSRPPHPRGAEGGYLAAKYRVKAEIVAGRRQDRGICGERHRRDRRPVRLVADHQFRSDVLSISGAAAVAENQQLAAPDGLRSATGRAFCERVAQPTHERLERGAVLIRLPLQESAEFCVQSDLLGSSFRHVRHPGRVAVPPQGDDVGLAPCGLDQRRMGVRICATRRASPR